MRVRRRAGAHALALVALLAGAAGFGGSRAARADDANAECKNNSDITFVVDFQDLGGGVNVRCAPQPVDSGRAAFVRTNTAMDDYQGFVCRIAGVPEEGPCNRYPPASAYWVYWVAARGGQWCASNNGIDNRTPPPGTIEGWSFAKNKKKSSLPPPRYPVPAPIPGTTPNQLNPGDCDAPSPTTTTAPPSVPVATTQPSGEAPGGSTATAVPRRGGSRAATTTTRVTAPGETTTSSPSDVLVFGAATTTSQVPFGNVDLTIRHHDDRGTPWGVVATGGAIAVIGSLGYVLRRQRIA